MDVVTLACNPSYSTDRWGRKLQIWGQLMLHSEFKVSLINLVKLSQKKGGQGAWRCGSMIEWLSSMLKS
jgi:hypothetical protein